MVNVERVISNAVIRVLHDNPFYGHILCQIPKVYSEQVPTLGVGRRKDSSLMVFYVNPKYVEHIYEIADKSAAFDHFVEVVKHEVHHIVFRHCFMPEPTSYPAQMAAECAANSYIDRKKLVSEVKDENGKLLPAGVFPEDFGLVKELGYNTYYEFFKKEEEKQQKQKKQQSGNGNSQNGSPQSQSGSSSGSSNGSGQQQQSSSGQQQQSSGQGNSQGQGQQSQQSQDKNGSSSGNGDDQKEDSGDGNGDGKDEKTSKMLDSHAEWGDFKDDEITEMTLKGIIQNAVDRAKAEGKWGSVPADVRQEVEGFLEVREQKVPWQTVLKDFISSASETCLDYTNRKPSRRFGTRPGTVKDDVLNLAIAIDTSGSVDCEMLETFFSELYWISKQGAKIDVFECDAEIQREYPFKFWEGSVEVKGGGGTDLEPVFREVSLRRYDALIYFTDGQAPVIEENYNIPTILVLDDEHWKISKEDIPYPYAQFVFHVREDGVEVEK